MERIPLMRNSLPHRLAKRMLPGALYGVLQRLFDLYRVRGGHSHPTQYSQPTQFGEAISSASDAYLSGARIQDLERYFVDAAAAQDADASSSGLSNFSLRIMGPHWGRNIGHLSLIDVVAKLKALGLLSPEDRFLCFAKTANDHYFGYVSQLFPSLSLEHEQMSALNFSLDCLQDSTSFLRLSNGITSLYPAISLAHRNWNDRPPLLSLSSDDLEWGASELARLNSSHSDWFVTFHVRDGDRRVGRSAPNAEVCSYLPAMREVVNRGGVAVRIGDRRMPKLPTVKGIVDYAHATDPSPRLNTYLMAACRFFVGTASGPLTVPHSFGVPTLYTNAPAVGLVPEFPNTLTLLKKYVDVRNGRLLHAEEVAERPIAWTVNPSADPFARGVCNTSAELRDGVVEMLEHTESADRRVVLRTVEQSAVYSHFRQLLGEHSGVHLSETFLATNKAWLL